MFHTGCLGIYTHLMAIGMVWCCEMLLGCHVQVSWVWRASWRANWNMRRGRNIDIWYNWGRCFIVQGSIVLMCLKERNWQVSLFSYPGVSAPQTLPDLWGSTPSPAKAGISRRKALKCLGLSDTVANCFKVLGQGRWGSNSLGPKSC